MCIFTSALYWALTKIQRSEYIQIARAIVNYIAMGTNKLESKHMASYINYIYNYISVVPSKRYYRHSHTVKPKIFKGEHFEDFEDYFWPWKFCSQKNLVLQRHLLKLTSSLLFKLTVPLVINILSTHYLWLAKLWKFYHESFF